MIFANAQMVSGKIFYIDHEQCDEEKWNYKKLLSENPKIKKFIEILGDRLQYEVKARLKLEEKTLNIFYNDLKNIDNLVPFYLTPLGSKSENLRIP
jgi:hypothetical protein